MRASEIPSGGRGPAEWMAINGFFGSVAPNSAGFRFAPVRSFAMMAGMNDGETMVRPQSTASAELARLMARVAAKDAASLKELYDRTSAKLYGVCLRLLRDEAEAQDILQEVYLTIWRKAAMFDPARASAITWTATLARNKAIDRLRARSAPTDQLDDDFDIADDQPSSLDVLEQAEDADRLRDCLETLDGRARTMIRSAFFDGASYPELAKREGVPLPTMKSWIRRGLLSLRGCLEQ